MNDPAIAYWAPALGGLAAFAALWLGVCFGVAGSGWNAFARRYATTVVPPAKSRYFTARSARLGGLFSSYRNVVRVVFLPAGIHFSVMFLFRAGHPPFMMPWAGVVRAEYKSSFLAKRFELEIQEPAGRIRLWLSPAAEEAMAAARAAAG
jgi:hypothetical protein